MTCPGCGGELVEVRYPGGPLNVEQWSAVRAGDWWCRACPDNGRGRSGAYWWMREVVPAPGPTLSPDEVRIMWDWASSSPMRGWLRRPGGGC